MHAPHPPRTMHKLSDQDRPGKLQKLLDVLADDGVCADAAPHDWFVTGGDNYLALHNRGLMVCQGCPAKDACLEYAEAAGETEGVWGAVELSRSVSAERARSEGVEFRRRKFRQRAARWLAAVRFEERRGRAPTSVRSDREMVGRLAREVERELEAGRVPIEIEDDADQWDIIGPRIVGDGDDLPAEFVAAVEAAWRAAS